MVVDMLNRYEHEDADVLIDRSVSLYRRCAG